MFSLRRNFERGLFYNRYIDVISQMEDSVRNAPKKNSLHSAQPPASHNDHIDAFRLCKFDDPVRRISLQHGRLDIFHAALLGLPFGLLDDLLRQSVAAYFKAMSEAISIAFLAWSEPSVGTRIFFIMSSHPPLLKFLFMREISLQRPIVCPRQGF